MQVRVGEFPIGVCPTFWMHSNVIDPHSFSLQPVTLGPESAVAPPHPNAG